MASKQDLSTLAKGVVGLAVDADFLGLERVRDALDLAFYEVRRSYLIAYPKQDVGEEGAIVGAGEPEGGAS